MRVKRPKSRTVCTQCLRKREPKFIEWQAAIDSWECSDFRDCYRITVTALAGDLE